MVWGGSQANVTLPWLLGAAAARPWLTMPLWSPPGAKAAPGVEVLRPSPAPHLQENVRAGKRCESHREWSPPKRSAIPVNQFLGFLMLLVSVVYIFNWNNLLENPATVRALLGETLQTQSYSKFLPQKSPLWNLCSVKHHHHKQYTEYCFLK